MHWRTGGAACVLWLALLVSSLEHGNAEQRIVCYYTNWSVYRPGTAKYSPQNINPYLCTHLIYAFGGFTKDNTLKPFDKYQDVEKGGYAKFTGLKTYNKNLKLMLAIGGWNEGSSRFSPLVADPERRKELVKNSIKFLRQNHFDGLDLDWEYPAFRDGGKPRDKNNYADLVQELREEFERESSKTGRPRLLLSMAIPAGIEYLEKGYDLPKLNEYLDFFNLLSYDYHSAFEPSVNHHSPLYGLEEDNEYNFDTELTIDFTINYLLKHDVTSNKIVLGIPTYGRSYTLVNDESTEIGSPAEGPGEEGDATREKGYLAYYEICENIAKSDDWEVVQPNPKAMGPYAFKGNQWVGYDDESIVRVKALYVNEKKLGGIMFWSIDNDDFRGKCHGRPYPLIEAAKETLLTGSVNKSLGGQKTKTSGNRKKTKTKSNQRGGDDDGDDDRKVNLEQNRDNNKVQSTRKRTTTSRPSGSRSKSRGDVNENNFENDEQESNTLREGSSKNRAKSRNRNRAGSRRKEQNSKRNEEAQQSESESLSNKLTTPEPPTTPDPGSDFKCEDEGFFSHPRDCKKYFWCLDSGGAGLGVVAHAFTCPSGLVFNKAADSCDYPRNVICPKAKSNTPTTTRAPITSATSRTSFVQSTTRRTTTPETKSSKEEEEEEEYEYEDEEINTAEESSDEIPISTTSKPHQYKTISRSRPTTTTTTTDATTTTEAQTTTISSRFSKTTEKEINIDDEEDPRVIKELIDLIKKAGGLEQLEKQLNYQEKNSGKVKIEGNDKMTPATISRSLYERVLNRQATRFGGAFGITSPRTTTVDKTQSVVVQNAPGSAQFQGLDDVPEVKSLRRNNKPQYVMIERQKVKQENSGDDEEAAIDETEHDDADVASSEDGTVSNLSTESENKSSNKRITPSYVNIRRSRPTTPASENDLDDRDELIEKPELNVSQEQHDKIESEEEETAKSGEEAVQKSRYTNTHRFRSTTSKFESSIEDVKPVNEVSLESTSLPSLPETEAPKNPFIPNVKSSSTIPVSSTEQSISSSTTETVDDKIPVTESSVQLVDNSVTEILLTTLPALSSTKSTPFKPSTSSVIQPRPFGFPKRGRSTTTTTTTSTTPTNIQSSSTESSRTKIVPENHVLPTLKQLIGVTLYPSSNTTINTVAVGTSTNSPIYQNNNDLIDVSVQHHKELQSAHVTENYNSQKANKGKKVPIKILGFGDSDNDSNHQYAFLNLPDGVFIPNDKKNILRIQVLEQDNYDESNGLNNKIDNHRVSKSRRIGSSARRRGSRNKIRAEEANDRVEENAPRRGASRKRGTSRLNIVNEISSTDLLTLTTTVKPTTIKGSSVPSGKISTSSRGFFVTKSIEKMPVTTDIPDLNSSDYLNFITTEVGYTTESSIGDELTTVGLSEETRNFSGSSESPTTTETGHDRVTENPLWALMTKYFDETTVTSVFQDVGELISSGEQTEISTRESLDKSSGITTESNYLNNNNNDKTEDKTTIIFETTTAMPLTTYFNDNSTEIKKNDTLISTTDISNDTDNELNGFNVKNEMGKNTEIPTTAEDIKMSFTSTEKIPEITTSSVTLITEDTVGSMTTEESKIPVSIIEQKEKLKTAETHLSFPSSSSSSSSSSTTTERISTTTVLSGLSDNKNIRSRARGKIRYQETPRLVETLNQRPSSRQSFRSRGLIKTTTENPIPVNPINSNQTIKITDKKIQELPVNEIINLPKKVINQRRRNSSPRNRARTSSTTMQSFMLTTTEIPDNKLEKGIVLEKNQPIDDQSIAESSHSEATQEVLAVKNTGIFLRRPVSLVRPSVPTIRSQTIIGQNLDGRFSSKMERQKSDNFFDQSGRAQELTVSRVDPATLSSFFETGKDTPTRNRGDQRHRLIETVFETTGAPTVVKTITTTSSPRSRQRQKSPEIFDKIAQPLRPRHPEIIDYDYYVDEDARLSIKPELKEKIYVTPVGRIGCLDQGTFAHPVSCKKFITCTKTGGRKIIATEYTCPTNLSFDPVGGICNWSAGLGCNNH